jgi:uncharacterized phage protein (TIGR02218 family)
MKTTTPELKAHLAQEVTTKANCWQLVRRDGEMFFFTDHDQDLEISGNTYLSAIGYQQTAITADGSLAVDNLEVTGILDSETLIADDLRSGFFDFAEIFLFTVNWADLSQGIMRLRRGTLGEISTTPAGTFQGELRGMAQRLVAKVGDIYTPECRADLGDAKCKVDLGPFTYDAPVVTVTDTRQFTLGGITDPRAVDDFFALGALTWTSGANNERSMEIKSWTKSTSTIGLFLPMPRPVAIGDTCRLFAGCDKRHDTCRDKFNNIVNRRAEDFIPGFDALIQTPNAVVA